MKKIFAVILAVLCLVSLCACQKKASDSDLAYVKEKGKLIVGITDFAPMDYEKDGKWIGFDADTAAAFAKSIGVEAEFLVIDWDNKENELNDKGIDCVWNGMTLNDGVLNSMSCSIPYCNNAQVVVVKSSLKDSIKSVDDLKDLSFAVEVGSAGKDVAAENELSFTEVADQATALMEVGTGTSDACIIDLLMSGAMIGEGTSYPNLAVALEFGSEQYGVGFRKGSDLVDALNDFFKKSYADGTLLETAKQYNIAQNIPEIK